MQTKNITIEQQIPITKMRNNLASVFKDLPKKKICYIVRNYRPLGAVIDTAYLQRLQRQADMWRMDQIEKKIQSQFAAVLRKKGYNPETVDEKTMNKLLMLDE